MGGIIEIKCPDCGGQIHLESYIGGDNRDPYSKYYCIGDRGLPKRSDGRKFKKLGCGFFAESKGPKDDKSTRLRSDSLDDWIEWDEHRGES